MMRSARSWFPLAAAAFVAAGMSRAEGTDAFHRAVETPRGWAFCAPDGRLWRARGIEKANGYGPDCGALGRPYAESFVREGLSREAWAARTAARLADWGFNLLGTACDRAINAKSKFAATEMIALSSWAADRGSEWTIAVDPCSPAGPLPNVFHPGFAALCDEAAQVCCAPHCGEKNFLGYYLDNERNWWGTGNWFDCGLLDAVLEKLPARHAARRAGARTVEKLLGLDVKRYLVLPAAKREEARKSYARETAEMYFGMIAAAVRRHDPDHLILGCRFAGVAGGPDEVWEACGKHCDVVSFNCYPNADLEKGELWLSVQDGMLPKGVARTGTWTRVPLETMLERRYAAAKKPLFVSEWSFRGGDVGTPRKESNGQELPTQAARGRAIALFLAALDRLPYASGHAWYMWTDEIFPAGKGQPPETLNWGLVDLDDNPHAEVAAAFRVAKEKWEKGR
jgi:agarase